MKCHLPLTLDNYHNYLSLLISTMKRNLGVSSIGDVTVRLVTEMVMKLPWFCTLV